MIHRIQYSVVVAGLLLFLLALPALAGHGSSTDAAPVASDAVASDAVASDAVASDAASVLEQIVDFVVSLVSGGGEETTLGTADGGDPGAGQKAGVDIEPNG